MMSSNDVFELQLAVSFTTSGVEFDSGFEIGRIVHVGYHSIPSPGSAEGLGAMSAHTPVQLDVVGRSMIVSGTGMVSFTFLGVIALVAITSTSSCHPALSHFLYCAINRLLNFSWGY